MTEATHTPPGLCLEPGRWEELECLWRLFNAARADHPCFGPQAWSLMRFRGATQGEALLVARTGDTLAGFAAVWEPDRFIHHLYVAPEAQRRGVGRALVDACAQHFGRPLSLKCLTANHDARRFYRATGWREGQCHTGPDGPYVVCVLA